MYKQFNLVRATNNYICWVKQLKIPDKSCTTTEMLIKLNFYNQTHHTQQYSAIIFCTNGTYGKYIHSPKNLTRTMA